MLSLALYCLCDNPEQALRNANRKFTQRFQALERSLAAAELAWEDQSPDALEARWQRVKSAAD